MAVMKKVIFDRRETTRVNYQGAAELVTAGGAPTVWQIQDVSLKGMQVVGGDPALFVLGHIIPYKIILSSTAEHLVIKGDGKIVWISEGRKMGVRFMGIDGQSLEHLRRLMELNLGDGDQIEKELKVFPQG